VFIGAQIDAIAQAAHQCQADHGAETPRHHQFTHGIGRVAAQLLQLQRQQNHRQVEDTTDQEHEYQPEHEVPVEEQLTRDKRVFGKARVHRKQVKQNARGQP